MAINQAKEQGSSVKCQATDTCFDFEVRNEVKEYP